MKLILREYLASLREREELDAILPDLLSELGFTVYSRPGRGTTQYGVDVAAVSPENATGRKVYLFAIKKGDLTRQEWSGSSPQALRSSLTAILDAYIPARIPPEYTDLPIVICICLGGDIQEQVQQEVAGFCKANTKDPISFEDWNGDKLAGLLLKGVLKENLFPKPMRSAFQKAVALLDEPDVSYRHFSTLVEELRRFATDDKSRVRVARQLYVCLWVLYVWARDIDNVESAYRASELALLNTWELMKPLIGKDTSEHRALARVLDQLIRLHLIIAHQFLDEKIAPHCKARDALGMAVASRTAVDVNLKLFDVLGRIAMTGLMLKWLSDQQQGAVAEAATGEVGRLLDVGMSMIESNAALHLPVSDDQVTDISLFLLLCLVGGPIDGRRVMQWLQAMVERCDFCVRCNGRYPTSFTEYTDLVEHPRHRTQEYFEEATAGSTLVPLLAGWTSALGRPDLATQLARLTADKLKHSTMQLWTPGIDSEAHLYVDSDAHGAAICDLPVRDNGIDLLERIAEACRSVGGFEGLSAMRTGFWPIVLMACRHWRLPVPPEFYVSGLMSIRDKESGEAKDAQVTDAAASMA
jgi:hypothetical protein